MPRWKCSRCRKSQESNVKRVNASGKQIWPLYQLLEGSYADYSGKLCPSCHLQIQHNSGELSKKRGGIRVLSSKNLSANVEVPEARNDSDQTRTRLSSTFRKQKQELRIQNESHASPQMAYALGQPQAPESMDILSSEEIPASLQVPEVREMRLNAGLRGLRNIGNTCFMSSIIQCLSNTKPLIDFILSADRFKVNRSSSTNGKIFLAFARLLQNIWNSEETSEVDITLLKLQIQRHCPDFRGSRQHDSQEFLMCLLDGLHTDLADNQATFSIPIIPGNLPDEEKSRHAWEIEFNCSNSLVKKIFVGQMKSTLTCLVCRHRSATFEPFWNLSLAIPVTTVIASPASLEDCLTIFTQEEVLGEDEYPTCQQCQKKQPSTKRLSIQRFPHILVIQLKRFTQGDTRKLDTVVNFPLQNLDLRTYSDGADRNSSYNLFAISSHLGTTLNGHYVAFAKHPYSNQWHKYDDHRVIRSDSTELGSVEAYVMLYERAPSLEFLLGQQIGDSTRMDTDAAEFQDENMDPEEIALSSQTSSISASSVSSICDTSRPTTASSGSAGIQSGKHIILRKTLSCKTTQAKCFICGIKTNGRVRVPKPERDRVWNVARIRIPKDNRCCRSHIQFGRFQEEDMEIISSSSELSTRISVAEVEAWIHELSAKVAFKGVRVDFDSNDLQEEDYTLLTGVKKRDFDNLLQYLGKEVKSSKNRSLRNALGMFLMKMRLNLSHSVLQFLFGISNMPTISDTIHVVAKVLNKNFVPKYLGIQHVTRDDLKATKSISSFSRLVNASEDQLLLILDGTYLFIQKASDFEFQRKTFSAQKARNLLKPMMVITTTGYILEVMGLYGADGKNNDANILKHIMSQPESIGSFLLENDVMILDRGFRDVIARLQGLGICPKMPQLLKRKQNQFTTSEANQSRSVTMIRWMVESVNGRLKNMFKFFAGTICNSHIPSLKIYLDIACSIINAYSPPLISESLDLNNLIDKAVERMAHENELQKFIEDNGLERKRSQWVEADADSFLTFPKLTLEDIKDITLGTYQIKMAELYTYQHLSPNSTYKILLHKEDTTLIRAKIHSRFSNSKSHNLWIRFQENGVGGNSVQHYCKCKTGTRTVGICAHITSVIWYLGYARHNPEVLRGKRQFAHVILDAALELGSNPNDGDEDEESIENEFN